MAEHFNPLLGALLLEENVIDGKMLDEALLNQIDTGKKLGRILIDKGYIDEETLYKFLGKQIGIEFKTKIESGPIPGYFELIPYDYCLKNRIAPYILTTKTIGIYISDPSNRTIINELSFMTGRTIEADYATESAVMDYLRKYSRANARNAGKTTENEHPEADYLSEKNSPVVKYIDNTITEAIAQNASDIHFEIFENKALLKYRIDGRLHKADEPDKDLYTGLISRIKIMSDLDISERRLPQDGKAVFRYENRQVDIRISVIPTIYGENAVLRLLDKEKSILSIDDLGLSEIMSRDLKKEAERPNGMVLITGPTGSGKTTTLYAILQYIKQSGQKIITIEDPVEYRIDGVSQVQAHPDIGLTFAAGQGISAALPRYYYGR